MESIILAFKVIFPILAYISIGYFLKIIKVFDEKGIKTVNNLVFKVFLPCLLFYNIYTTDIEQILNINLILYSMTVTFVLFLILVLIVPVFISKNNRIGVFIQGVFRSNFVLFGMPVTMSLLGEGNAGLTSLAIAFVVPLYNVLAVISLEIFRKNKFDILSIIIGILKNPLIISSALGMVFLISGIESPELFSGVVLDLSRVATPLALIGLGGSLTFRSVRNNFKALSFIIFLKLIAVPVVALGLGAYVFGFEGAAIVTLISMFASPTAVSSFTMAQSMDGDADLAAQIVVFTSVFSILTVFAVIAVTKQLGLF